MRDISDEVINFNSRKKSSAYDNQKTYNTWIHEGCNEKCMNNFKNKPFDISWDKISEIIKKRRQKDK